jgi:2-methylisocitrate lyase-like PEP mutase family enzyme
VTDAVDLADRLRALHVPGEPLLLLNAWDAASARVVADAGLPAVATTSSGVARALGFDDGERTPVDVMLAAVARIAAAVPGLPVTADVEGGYGLPGAELAARLVDAGAAGCNLEDSDHAGEGLRDADAQAEYLGQVRRAADDDGYPLVINARIDVLFGPFLAGAGPGTQRELVPEAVRRAKAYVAAGVDCVFPIGLWETDALSAFMAEIQAPVNLVRVPQAPSLSELAEFGVARVSWGPFLYWQAMGRFSEQIASLQ